MAWTRVRPKPRVCRLVYLKYPGDTRLRRSRLSSTARWHTARLLATAQIARAALLVPMATRRAAPATTRRPSKLLRVGALSCCSAQRFAGERCLHGTARNAPVRQRGKRMSLRQWMSCAAIHAGHDGDIAVLPSSCPPGRPEQQRLRGVAKSTLGVALVKPLQHHAVHTYRPHPLHR